MPSKAKLVTRSESTTSVVADNIPKNAGLTNAELDSNFLNLRDQSFGLVGDDSTGVDVQSGQTLTVTGTGGITVAVANDTVTIDGSAVSGGATLGDLQVSNFGYYTDDTFLYPSVTDANLILAGNNAGVVGIPDDDLVFFNGQTIGTYLRTTHNRSGLTYMGANSLGAQWTYTLQVGPDMDAAESAVEIRARSLLLNDDTNFDIIAAGGNGDLRIQNGGDQGTRQQSAVSVGHNYITLTDANDGEIVISPKTGKWVEIQGLKYPTSDGTAGQVITTNGSGTLSFTTIDGAINIDGGTADSTYGAITAIDGGDATT